jgi:hypothetical protein
MRIDHALVSSTLLDRVARAEILGRGSQREGFMGSDHCPLLVEIRPAGSGSVPQQHVASGSSVKAANGADATRLETAEQDREGMRAALDDAQPHEGQVVQINGVLISRADVPESEK